MSDKFKSVESLMDGYNPQRQLLEQTRKLVKKWEPTGLLEGMDKEHEVNGMAVLLENQARQLIDEASRTGTSANSEEWSGVALPLVRRIFGELAAQEFVSVQPMNLPSGLIFYLDFKYGTAQTDLHTNDSDVYGNTSGSGDASGGLYGAGKFGYSINDSDSAAQAIHASSVSSGNYTTGSAAWSDVDFEPDLSSSIVTGQFADDGLIKINVATAALSDYDEDGVRAFSISGSGFDEFFPAYTTLNAAKTQIAFIVKKSIAGAPGALVDSYHKVKGTNRSLINIEECVEIIKSIHSIIEERGEVFEARALESSNIVGKPLKSLKLPKSICIGAIFKDNNMVIPKGDTIVDVNDIIVVFAEKKSVKKLETILSIRMDLI